MPKKANLQERGQEMNTAIRPDTRTVKISASHLLHELLKKKRPYFCGASSELVNPELVQGIGDLGALGNACY